MTYELTDTQKAQIDEAIAPFVAAREVLGRILSGTEMYVMVAGDSICVDGWVTDLTPEQLAVVKQLTPANRVDP